MRGRVLKCSLLLFALTGWLVVRPANSQQLVGWGDSIAATNIPPNLTNVVAVACGNDHAVALLATGHVVAWGSNSAGQTNVPPGLTDVVAVAAGGEHNLALTASGTVVAWGSCLRGQTNVPPGLSNVVALAAGEEMSLALQDSGKVTAWGSYNDGTSHLPLGTPPGLSNVVAIAAGVFQALALKGDGQVIAWGDARYGQTVVPAALDDIVAIAGGSAFSLAVRRDGTVARWGRRTAVPTDLVGITAVTAGRECVFCLALTQQGTVAGWGEDTLGGDFLAVTNIPAGLSNVVAIGALNCAALALVESPPTPALTLAATYAAGRFSVTLPTRRGRCYWLEWRDSLAVGSWIAQTPVPGDGTPKDLTHTGTIVNSRFYRIRQQ